MSVCSLTKIVQWMWRNQITVWLIWVRGLSVGWIPKPFIRLNIFNHFTRCLQKCWVYIYIYIYIYIFHCHLNNVWEGLVDRDSSVGIAARYGLNGPGMESRCGRDFLYPFRPALGPTQTTKQRVPGLYRRVKRSGRDVDHPLQISAEVKDRVYIFSPSGSLWPVPGWTLPFTWEGLRKQHFWST